MKPTQSKTIIVKPVSSHCNLRCKYCYNGVQFRHGKKIPPMTLDIAERLHRFLPELEVRNIKLIWHGGEPLLRGLDFYKSVVMIQSQLLQDFSKLNIENSIMTNGTLVTNEWAAFLKENKWRLGVSLDGQKHIHDKFRVDSKGKGTFERVLNGRLIAEKVGISVGMISVITSETLKYPPEEVYQFLTSLSDSFDISPCWEPSRDGVTQEYVVEPEAFLTFIKSFFDIWWNNDDPKMDIRSLKNLLYSVIGGRPSNCAFNGNCSNFIAFDADGSVYPCGRLLDLSETVPALFSTPAPFSKALKVTCIGGKSWMKVA